MGLFDFLKKNNTEKEEVKPYYNSNRINIGFGGEEKTLTLYKQQSFKNEKEICVYIRDRIKNDRTPKYDFSLEKKSEQYTTLTYRSLDLIRVKWSDMARWIKIPINNDEMFKEYESDSLFKAQTNKKEYMWKSECFDESDIEKLYPVILKAFDNIDNVDNSGFGIIN